MFSSQNAALRRSVYMYEARPKRAGQIAAGFLVCSLPTVASRQLGSGSRRQSKARMGSRQRDSDLAKTYDACLSWNTTSSRDGHGTAAMLLYSTLPPATTVARAGTAHAGSCQSAWQADSNTLSMLYEPETAEAGGSPVLRRQAFAIVCRLSVHGL